MVKTLGLLNIYILLQDCFFVLWCILQRLVTDMKPLCYGGVLWALFLVLGCNNRHQQPSIITPPILPKTDTTLTAVADDTTSPALGYYDSLINTPINTKTLRGKRQYILNHFLADNGVGGKDYDTLFDVNYDGHKDYIIGYYGACGSGLKNRVNVYLYVPKKKNYVLNEFLSQLPNPSFYINRKKITSFYLGNGAGGGGELRWIHHRWIEVMNFEADNHSGNNDSSTLIINYPLQHKSKKTFRPYFMIPPPEVLEHQWGDLDF